MVFGASGVRPGTQLLYEAFDPGTQPWTRLPGVGGVVTPQGHQWVLPPSLAQLEPGTWMLRVFTADQRSTAFAAIAVTSPLPLTGSSMPAMDDDDPQIDDDEEWEQEELFDGLDDADAQGLEGDGSDASDQMLARKKNQRKNKQKGKAKKPARRSRKGKGFTPFKTSPDSKVIYVPSGGNIRAGYDKLRNGYPDHLLLQAGGTYYLNGGLAWSKSGRSKEHPMVFGVVGKGGRPVIHFTGGGIRFAGTVSNTAFIGLHMTADDRNPGSPKFKSDGPRYDGFSLYDPAIRLTIEDCVVEYFAHGILLEGANDVDVRIHRSIIRNNWSPAKKGHSQGLYAYRTRNLVITDSLFDRNGWEPRAHGGERTIFNHNVYVIGIKTLRIENSMFTRGANNGLNIRTAWNQSEALENVVVRGNILIDNVNAIGVGNKTPKVVSRGLLIENNVMSRQGGVLNNSPQSMGISVASFRDIEIKNNYFIDKPFGGTSFAVKLDSSTSQGNVSGNVVHQWALSEVAVQTHGKAQKTFGNFVNQAGSIYADASRDLNRYMKAVGGGGGADTFIQWASNRPRGVWDDRPFNFADYIKKGFTPKFKK